MSQVPKTCAVALVASLTLLAPKAQGSAHDLADARKPWVALTVSGDGVWGIGTQHHKHAARVAAIRDCIFKAAGRTQDCGERVAMIKAGWLLAVACGAHTFVVAERSLAQAHVARRYRETEMRFVRRLKMPTCRTLVTLNPQGDEDQK